MSAIAAHDEWVCRTCPCRDKGCPPECEVHEISGRSRFKDYPVITGLKPGEDVMKRKVKIDGHDVEAIPHALYTTTCQVCDTTWYTQSNSSANFCPSCGSQDLKKQWMRLVLVSEDALL